MGFWVFINENLELKNCSYAHKLWQQLLITFLSQNTAAIIRNKDSFTGQWKLIGLYFCESKKESAEPFQFLLKMNLKSFLSVGFRSMVSLGPIVISAENLELCRFLAKKEGFVPAAAQGA